MTSSKSRLALSVLATTLALGLSACGKKDDEKVATQVAARVGSEEISVHQINQVLSRTNTAGATPQAVQTMSREVLEKLIDQQLAVEQATETKLNRSPEVVSQLEASRRDILARAYMQKIAAALSKPTPEEIKKYHVEHPQLFAERRIFNVQEIVVPAAAGVTEQLRGFASDGKAMEEAAAWLKGKDIKFGSGSATRAAEQIPLELLAQIHTLKDGQTVVIQGPQAVTLLRVASSQLSPIPEAAALPRIEQFLTNQRASEAVAANIKQLRSAAKIDYMGEFAKAEASPTAATPAAPTTVQAPATDGKATQLLGDT
ncbi:MAG: EpsD family peptidyl-prolyl cis-trans isomerase, partial [Hydrogenophaga sp.]|nr:EpsD family peptidyl-prolyl cis-trans isomerase [Hydrogenophaga sp.]